MLELNQFSSWLRNGFSTIAFSLGWRAVLAVCSIEPVTKLELCFFRYFNNNPK